MENRRLLLAALLSAVVLIAWNYVVMSLRPPEEVPTAPAGEPPPPGVPLGENEVGTPAPEDAGMRPAFGESVEDDATSTIDFAEEVVEAAGEELVALESERFRAEFTNLGAQLVSFRLKAHTAPDGMPLELVRPRGSDPYPFSLVVEGSKSHRLNKALFEWSEESEGGLPALRFRHRSDRGTAEKVFRLTPDDLIEVEVTVLGTSDWGLVFGPGIRRIEDGGGDERTVQRLAAFRRTDGESDEFHPPKVHEDVVIPGGGLSWVSLEDNFFLSAAIPRSGLGGVLIRPVLQRAEVRADAPRFLPIAAELDEEEPRRELILLLEARGERMELLTFFGAKQYRRLATLPYHLEESVRWGKFIGIFARPLYYALEWIHTNMVANYGWAIVLVTVLIRLIFFPLTYKSQDSMAKMQELNPKIQAIKAKYRGKLKDRQGRPNVEAHRAMQQEQSELFRQAGVNPAASCLPLILQMPVFFAFFKVLQTAVELRGAPWLGWIQDLSVQDPYFILPLVMGATSVAMQRMMPSAADPVQRRVIQLMPIMFTFFALYFPSGLVLYWVTNNLLSMLQQWLMLKAKSRKAGAEGRREARSET